jgi:hypothetical protein
MFFLPSRLQYWRYELGMLRWRPIWMDRSDFTAHYDLAWYADAVSRLACAMGWPVEADMPGADCH